MEVEKRKVRQLHAQSVCGMGAKAGWFDQSRGGCPVTPAERTAKTDNATLEEIRDHLRLIQTAVARGFGTDYMGGVAKSAIRDLDGLIAERSQEQ